MPPSRIPCFPSQPDLANGKVNSEWQRDREAKFGVASDQSPPDNKRPGYPDGAAGWGHLSKDGTEPQPAGGAGARRTALRRQRRRRRARRVGSALTRGGEAAGTTGRCRTPAPPPRGLGKVDPRAGRSGAGAERSRAPAAGRTPPPESRCSARRPRSPPPGCARSRARRPLAAPRPGRRRGRRGRRAYLLRCGGAAVASRGRDLRRRQRRRRQRRRRGGRFLQEGVGSARPPAPARRAAARPRLILGSPPRGLPRRAEPPVPRACSCRHPSGPLIVTRDWSRACPAEPLLSKAFVDAFAWRSSPNKREDRIWDPPPAGYLFLTCCNLLAGCLLSTHLGFSHRAAKTHFQAHWLNAVRRRSALSRGFLSSGGTNAGPTSDPGGEQRTPRPPSQRQLALFFPASRPSLR